MRFGCQVRFVISLIHPHFDDNYLYNSISNKPKDYTFFRLYSQIGLKPTFGTQQGIAEQAQ